MRSGLFLTNFEVFGNAVKLYLDISYQSKLKLRINKRNIKKIKHRHDHDFLFKLDDLLVSFRSLVRQQLSSKSILFCSPSQIQMAEEQEFLQLSAKDKKAQ